MNHDAHNAHVPCVDILDILDLYLGPGHQEVYDKREGKAEQGANGILHLAALTRAASLNHSGKIRCNS